MENQNLKLSKKLETIYNLKTAEARWAGGNNAFSVNIIKGLKSPIFEFSTYKEWSDNSKWSGLSCNFKLSISKNMTFEVIGGLITIRKKNTNACWWLKQGRGFEAKIIEGYIYKNYHEPKKNSKDNFEDAVKRIKTKRNKAAERLLERRSLSKPMNALDLKSIWVKREDSIKAGNCSAGTDRFISKIKNRLGEVGGIRADFLLELSNDSFVKRAIRYASVR